MMEFNKDDITVMNDYRRMFMRYVKDFVKSECNKNGIRLSKEANKDMVLQVATDLINGDSIAFIRRYMKD